MAYEKAIDSLASLAVVGVTAGLTFKILDNVMDGATHHVSKHKHYDPFKGLM